MVHQSAVMGCDDVEIRQMMSKTEDASGGLSTALPSYVKQEEKYLSGAESQILLPILTRNHLPGPSSTNIIFKDRSHPSFQLEGTHWWQSSQQCSPIHQELQLSTLKEDLARLQ
jgi:hypothetical protein